MLENLMHKLSKNDRTWTHNWCQNQSTIYKNVPKIDAKIDATNLAQNRNKWDQGRPKVAMSAPGGAQGVRKGCAGSVRWGSRVPKPAPSIKYIDKSIKTTTVREI